MDVSIVGITVGIVVVGIKIVGNIVGSMVGIIKVGSTVLMVGATVGLGVGSSSEVEHMKHE